MHSDAQSIGNLSRKYSDLFFITLDHRYLDRLELRLVQIFLSEPGKVAGTNSQPISLREVGLDQLEEREAIGLFQIGVVNIRNIGARTATQSYVTFEMQSLIDGERRLVIDAIAERHLADTRQAVTGTNFSHVQGRDQLQEGLLKETVFVLFVEQELQDLFPWSQGTRITLPMFFRASICA